MIKNKKVYKQSNNYTNMQIRKLTKTLLEENLNRLLNLETYYSNEEHEQWSKDNFLLPLEGKFDLSRIAFDDEKIAGYIILSIKKDNNLIFGYVHRAFINLEHRNSLLYLGLFSNARKDLKSLGIDTLRWRCSPDNKRVYEYHLTFADEIIKEEIINKKRYSLFQKKIF